MRVTSRTSPCIRRQPSSAICWPARNCSTTCAISPMSCGAPTPVRPTSRLTSRASASPRSSCSRCTRPTPIRWVRSMAPPTSGATRQSVSSRRTATMPMTSRRAARPVSSRKWCGRSTSTTSRSTSTWSSTTPPRAETGTTTSIRRRSPASADSRPRTTTI
ncbi:hypothetical protein SDC9_168968 [bioreactor metagenome]|uniref:Uncharacterized protein n=1 Tax=bioreactor metagenome TaxID=1076179 RepID=A0A645G401_9ZZZZ